MDIMYAAIDSRDVSTANIFFFLMSVYQQVCLYKSSKSNSYPYNRMKKN